MRFASSTHNICFRQEILNFGMVSLIFQFRQEIELLVEYGYGYTYFLTRAIR